MYNHPWPPPRFLRQPPPPLPRTHLPPHNASNLAPPSFDCSYFPPPPLPSPFPVQFCGPHGSVPSPWPSPQLHPQSVPVQYPVVPAGPYESISTVQDPTPPPPPSDPVLRITEHWTSWVRRIESLVIARRHRYHEQQTKSDSRSLSQIRNRFLRWHELIERIREGCADESTLRNELLHLQQECSDPEVIKRVQRKLALIRRKRRYKKRVRQQREDDKNYDDTVVVRCSISAVLEQLRNETSPGSNVTDRVSPSRSSLERRPSSSTALRSSGTTATTESTDRSLSGRHIRKDVVQIQQAVAECRERLALLSGLQRLRTARLTQARQKGGLFPEAFDQAFIAQINELTSLLNAQLTRLLDLEKVIQDSLTGADTPRQDRDKPDTDKAVMSSCCDHWPNLSDPWKQILFRSTETPKDIPWRWQRFYHQADFDFSDFLRIRKSWDSYIVQQEKNNGNAAINVDSSPSEAYVESEPSSLPSSWHAPLVTESPDPAWDVYCVS